MTSRFGESFHPDQTSRVKVLDQEAQIPEYVEFGRRIRGLLKGQDAETGEIKTNWPECPRGLTDLEGFFNAAKNAVAAEWQQASSDLLREKYQEWLEQIPETEDNRSVIDLLQNPEQIEKNLKIQQLGEIEAIADLGQEVLDNFYLKPAATPQAARQYIRDLRSKKDEARLKDLREQIKASRQ